MEGFDTILDKENTAVESLLVLLGSYVYMSTETLTRTYSKMSYSLGVKDATVGCDSAHVPISTPEYRLVSYMIAASSWDQSRGSL